MLQYTYYRLLILNFLFNCSNNKFYSVVPTQFSTQLFSEPKNWDDASKDCETYGGSLMSIHDDETNSKLDQFG